MWYKRIKVTKDNINEIHKFLNYHLVSLTLTLEQDSRKKFVPKVRK